MTELERAIKELELAGLFEKDNGVIGKAVKELLLVLREQNHSRLSAAVVSRIFYDLIRGRVLSPLTGKAEEWINVGGGLLQNRRCSAVFSTDGGKTGYWTDGIVFVSKNKAYWLQGKFSRVSLKFPCMLPETRYVHEGTAEAEKFKEVFKRDD